MGADSEVGEVRGDLGRFLRAEWDRLAGYGCVAAGVVLLIAGFVGVRTSADVIDEISYLVTGGIGSIFLLGVGATLLLSADLHDDFRKLHRVEEKLDRVERLLLAQHPELVDAANGDRVKPPNLTGDTSGEGPGGSAATAAEPGSASAVRAGAGAVPAAARATLAVRRGRIFAGIGVIVAAVLFVAGALRTANEPGTDHMAGSVGVALGGALLVALVAALMVAQLRAAVEQRKVAVLGNWLAVGCDNSESATAVAAAERGPVLVVAGLPLYHRARCQLLHDRSVTEIDRAGLSSGAAPCQLCEPD